ncbi:DUF29 domain-containing protein [Methylobacterium trifolii]|uniref:DUF29 domain-containing protein n=1 Tax=Methylobacterium trifolii TaxID=1003092 RepID=A0ABQ4U317_9HYPH|nr:DUF29 domain-containing protein [Methylobacterium trifolii]GJE60495.1 hypothetical protein MPOCJGCO_2607 [Methylobacterium trifolii]
MSRAILRNDLYAADLSAWAEAQVRALHEGRFDDLDHDRLSEVVAGLASRERRELRERLQVILTGLLRWAQQVDLRCRGWAATIDAQRHRVERLLRDNPSLAAAVPNLVAEGYPAARARAVLESALFDESFSAACPFTPDEILTAGLYPDPYGDDAVRGAGWWKSR